jgi:hypothetical protein
VLVEVLPPPAPLLLLLAAPLLLLATPLLLVLPPPAPPAPLLLVLPPPAPPAPPLDELLAIPPPAPPVPPDEALLALELLLADVELLADVLLLLDELLDPPHTPAWHIPTAHGVPSGLAGLSHPLPGVHVPATWHSSRAWHVTATVPVHTPARHLSLLVQTFPSLQAIPSSLVGLVHCPVV